MKTILIVLILLGLSSNIIATPVTDSMDFHDGVRTNTENILTEKVFEDTNPIKDTSATKAIDIARLVPSGLGPSDIIVNDVFSNLGPSDIIVNDVPSETSTPVPEPMPLALIALGLIGLGVFRRAKTPILSPVIRARDKNSQRKTTGNRLHLKIPCHFLTIS